MYDSFFKPIANSTITCHSCMSSYYFHRKQDGNVISILESYSSANFTGVFWSSGSVGWFSFYQSGRFENVATITFVSPPIKSIKVAIDDVEGIFILCRDGTTYLLQYNEGKVRSTFCGFTSSSITGRNSLYTMFASDHLGYVCCNIVRECIFLFKFELKGDTLSSIGKPFLVGLGPSSIVAACFASSSTSKLTDKRDHLLLSGGGRKPKQSILQSYFVSNDPKKSSIDFDLRGDLTLDFKVTHLISLTFPASTESAAQYLVIGANTACAVRCPQFGPPSIITKITIPSSDPLAIICLSKSKSKLDKDGAVQWLLSDRMTRYTLIALQKIESNSFSILSCVANLQFDTINSSSPSFERSIVAAESFVHLEDNLIFGASTSGPSLILHVKPSPSPLHIAFSAHHLLPAFGSISHVTNIKSTNFDEFSTTSGVGENTYLSVLKPGSEFSIFSEADSLPATNCAAVEMVYEKSGILALQVKESILLTKVLRKLGDTKQNSSFSGRIILERERLVGLFQMKEGCDNRAILITNKRLAYIYFPEQYENTQIILTEIPIYLRNNKIGQNSTLEILGAAVDSSNNLITLSTCTGDIVTVKSTIEVISCFKSSAAAMVLEANYGVVAWSPFNSYAVHICSPNLQTTNNFKTEGDFNGIYDENYLPNENILKVNGEVRTIIIQQRHGVIFIIVGCSNGYVHLFKDPLNTSTSYLEFRPSRFLRRMCELHDGSQTPPILICGPAHRNILLSWSSPFSSRFIQLPIHMPCSPIAAVALPSLKLTFLACADKFVIGGLVCLGAVSSRLQVRSIKIGRSVSCLESNSEKRLLIYGVFPTMMDMQPYSSTLCPAAVLVHSADEEFDLVGRFDFIAKDEEEEVPSALFFLPQAEELWVASAVEKGSKTGGNTCVSGKVNILSLPLASSSSDRMEIEAADHLSSSFSSMQSILKEPHILDSPVWKLFSFGVDLVLAICSNEIVLLRRNGNVIEQQGVLKRRFLSIIATVFDEPRGLLAVADVMLGVSIFKVDILKNTLTCVMGDARGGDVSCMFFLSDRELIIAENNGRVRLLLSKQSLHNSPPTVEDESPEEIALFTLSNEVVAILPTSFSSAPCEIEKKRQDRAVSLVTSCGEIWYLTSISDDTFKQLKRTEEAARRQINDLLSIQNSTLKSDFFIGDSSLAKTGVIDGTWLQLIAKQSDYWDIIEKSGWCKDKCKLMELLETLNN